MNRRKNDKSKRGRASEVLARPNLHLIIDGYNLMHVTRFKPPRQEAGELRRCRKGLLSLLAERLSKKQYRQVTIVFDSRQAPKRLPDRQQFRHLEVLFARHENTADDLIAKLVQKHPHWQQLVVISSDHRVQKAARRRKATVLDSDVWFDALLEYNPTTQSDVPSVEASPAMDDQDLADFIREMAKLPETERTDSSVDLRRHDELQNPFPEGYFDDLEEG